VKEQRRARKIAMSPEERDAFLGEERTCRVASLGADGSPHVTPLWFVWDGEALWLNSLTKSQRWTDLERDPRVAVMVDAGHDYGELRGVEIRGTVAAVDKDDATGPGQAFADKYANGVVGDDGRHGWLRLTPEKITSWDFRKMGT
jgi:PPOX class probable F420-dependent enzyme